MLGFGREQRSVVDTTWSLRVTISARRVAQITHHPERYDAPTSVLEPAKWAHLEFDIVTVSVREPERSREDMCAAVQVTFDSCLGRGWRARKGP